MNATLSHIAGLITEAIRTAADQADRSAIEVLAETDIHAEIQNCGLSAAEATAACESVRNAIAAKLAK